MKQVRSKLAQIAFISVDGIIGEDIHTEVSKLLSLKVRYDIGQAVGGQLYSQFIMLDFRKFSENK